MKKLILVVMLVMVASVAFGQASANQTANANLTVNSGMSMTLAGNLAFGMVMQGATATVNPNTAPIGNVAAFTTTSSASTVLNVSYVQTDLTSGANTLSWTPNLVGNDVGAAQRATAAAVPSGSTVTSSATGAYYFWLGGSVVTLPATPAGSYTGTFTLTVAY